MPQARDVLYVALEGSRTGLRARIGALARGLATSILRATNSIGCICL